MKHVLLVYFFLSNHDKVCFQLRCKYGRLLTAEQIAVVSRLVDSVPVSLPITKNIAVYLDFTVLLLSIATMKEYRVKSRLNESVALIRI